MLGRLLMNDKDLPIINVLRFEDGKIVEFWNHRHDIDTGRTVMFKAQGFAFGLIPSVLLLVYVILLRRRLKRARAA